MPLAATVNWAFCPAVMVTLAGWVVKAGATGAGVTVSVAMLLVTLPVALVAITRYCLPLSPTTVAGVV